MGVNNAAVIFLSGARAHGVDFTKTLTLGRQSFFPEPKTLARVFAARGLALSADRFVKANPFADQFLALLGAREIVSVDYSQYEQATRVHDMNQPLPAELRETATLVYDGGTLEHVFNAPQAFKNCMEMVQVGGHFLQINNANNFLGHGFWQFSPELLFRMFTAENGFEIEAMLMHEAESGDWYRVSDPHEVRSRVQLCNCRPTYILTIARRVASTDIFARPPQQSDYAPLWAGAQTATASSRSRRWGGIRQVVPSSLIRFVKPLLIDHSLFGLGWNKSYYHRLSAEAVAHGRFA